LKVFTTNCATCHKLAGVGNEIGPDLRSVSGWESEALLVAILDPNRQVEPRYLSYTAVTSGGDTVFGVITADSAGSITIKGLDAKEQTLPRSALKSLEGTNKSLMPEGLESAVTDQDLADVIKFLQTPH
jgi:putative heme-binding domain-containing protein